MRSRFFNRNSCAIQRHKAIKVFFLIELGLFVCGKNEGFQFALNLEVACQSQIIECNIRHTFVGTKELAFSSIPDFIWSNRDESSAIVFLYAATSLALEPYISSAFRS